MNKSEFFTELNNKLSLKYQTKPEVINFIRTLFLGYRLTRKQIAELAAIKLNSPKRHKGPHKGKRTKSKIFYQEILNLSASASSEKWNDINQLTEFDKGASPNPLQ